jgi:hypothetical protein
MRLAGSRTPAGPGRAPDLATQQTLDASWSANLSYSGMVINCRNR